MADLSLSAALCIEEVRSFSFNWHHSLTHTFSVVVSSTNFQYFSLCAKPSTLRRLWTVMHCFPQPWARFTVHTGRVSRFARKSFDLANTPIDNNVFHFLRPVWTGLISPQECRCVWQRCGAGKGDARLGRRLTEQNCAWKCSSLFTSDTLVSMIVIEFSKFVPEQCRSRTDEAGARRCVSLRVVCRNRCTSRPENRCLCSECSVTRGTFWHQPGQISSFAFQLQDNKRQPAWKSKTCFVAENYI